MFRYRALDATGDMIFGRGGADFLVDTPEAVAQSILTRLELWQGTWFLDLTDGTPWMQQVLGKPRGPGTPDAAIRLRILGTSYVTRIEDYASRYDPTSRSWAVSCKVFTSFGQVTTAPLGAAISPSGALVMWLRSPTGSAPAAPAIESRLPAY